MKRLVLLGLCLSALAAAVPARAQPANAAGDASQHFQRGVDLYNEGDLRGALVEFKKAYTLLPRANVLYDIGQTQFQLQEYAESLTTLERYLAETGPSAAHRAEVVETVAVLRGRVGRISLRTDRVDCDVAIDDRVFGTTPVDQSIPVSIGRRKVAVSCADQPPVTRIVEVAAGETVHLDVKLGPGPAPALPRTIASLPPSGKHEAERSWVVPAWTATAVLAASAIGVYAAALVESRRLGVLRRNYPVTAEQLDEKATLTSRLALTGDILALTTVVAAGLSTYLSLGSHQERSVHVGLSLAGVAVHGSF
jgi:tetratricopeptide (TPR) repeat protein